MAVSGVGTTTTPETNKTNKQDTTQDITNAARDTLGKDAFLQLLVTQMRYQDPLDPMDNGEYLSQLAQFSALEQMTNVAEGLAGIMDVVNNIDTSLLVGQLTSMIGQGVQWETEDGKAMEGSIKAVSIADGIPSIVAETADGKQYRVLIGQINRIGTLDSSEKPPEPENKPSDSEVDHRTGTSS